MLRDMNERKLIYLNMDWEARLAVLGQRLEREQLRWGGFLLNLPFSFLWMVGVYFYFNIIFYFYKCFLSL